MHKGLKGVEVSVTSVPLPLASILVGSEVTSAPVVGETAESKETSASRDDRGTDIKDIIVLKKLEHCLIFGMVNKQYCIAENFSEIFNVAVWQIFLRSPNNACAPMTLTIQIAKL